MPSQKYSSSEGCSKDARSSTITLSAAASGASARSRIAEDITCTHHVDHHHHHPAEGRQAVLVEAGSTVAGRRYTGSGTSSKEGKNKNEEKAKITAFVASSSTSTRTDAHSSSSSLSPTAISEPVGVGAGTVAPTAATATAVAEGKCEKTSWMEVVSKTSMNGHSKSSWRQTVVSGDCGAGSGSGDQLLLQVQRRENHNDVNNEEDHEVKFNDQSSKSSQQPSVKSDLQQQQQHPPHPHSDCPSSLQPPLLLCQQATSKASPTVSFRFVDALENEYSYHKKDSIIGKGSYSVVYRASRKQQVPVLPVYLQQQQHQNNHPPSERGRGEDEQVALKIISKVPEGFSIKYSGGGGGAKGGGDIHNREHNNNNDDDPKTRREEHEEGTQKQKNCWDERRDDVMRELEVLNRLRCDSTKDHCGAYNGCLQLLDALETATHWCIVTRYDPSALDLASFYKRAVAKRGALTTSSASSGYGLVKVVANNDPFSFNASSMPAPFSSPFSSIASLSTSCSAASASSVLPKGGGHNPHRGNNESSFSSLPCSKNVLCCLTQSMLSPPPPLPHATSASAISEAHASLILTQIIAIVRILHEEQNLIHRDLKPENFLIMPVASSALASATSKIKCEDEMKDIVQHAHIHIKDGTTTHCNENSDDENKKKSSDNTVPSDSKNAASVCNSNRTIDIDNNNNKSVRRGSPLSLRRHGVDNNLGITTSGASNLVGAEENATEEERGKPLTIPKEILQAGAVVLLDFGFSRFLHTDSVVVTSADRQMVCGMNEGNGEITVWDETRTRRSADGTNEALCNKSAPPATVGPNSQQQQQQHHTCASLLGCSNDSKGNNNTSIHEYTVLPSTMLKKRSDNAAPVSNYSNWCHAGNPTCATAPTVCDEQQQQVHSDGSREGALEAGGAAAEMFSELVESPVIPKNRAPRFPFAPKDQRVGAAECPCPEPLLLLTSCGTDKYLPYEALLWVLKKEFYPSVPRGLPPSYKVLVPSQPQHRPTSIAHAKALDSFAIGVMAHILLSGRLPFDGSTQTALFLQQNTLRASAPRPALIEPVLKPAWAKEATDDYSDRGSEDIFGTYTSVGSAQNSHHARPRSREEGIAALDSPSWKHVSEEAKHLVRGLTHVNPSKRWTLKKALACPWVQSIGLPLAKQVLPREVLVGLRLISSIESEEEGVGILLGLCSNDNKKKQIGLA